MKSVIKSVSPRICEKVTNGNCKILISKTAPKCHMPFKCYIYCTKSGTILYGDGKSYVTDNANLLKGGFQTGFQIASGFSKWNGKVIGEFICNKVDEYTFSHYEAEYRVTHVEQNAMCLNQPELIQYGKGKTLYGWHISDLKIYDKPKELSEFISPSKAKKCVDYCMNGICSNLGYEELCGAIRRCEYKKLTRPPQSWMYVE